MKNKIFISSIILFAIILCGWGSVGHKIINTKTVVSFPSAMSEFTSWSAFLAQHASDADKRKSSSDPNYDPNESPKHFIDIDEYNEFNTTGRIPQDYDSMVTIHGSYTVINNGILPWAILASVDSLKAQFSRRDWNKAQQTAADLGHYVGDSHMPLHITKNYNPGGLHSRYESTMIGKYENSIQYTPDSAQYIPDVKDFVFTYIYGNYKYVDSVLIADNAAKTYAGGSTSSSVYYQKLWELTGNFTIRLFSQASSRLASLIYTAWINAGSPSLSGVTSIDKSNNVPADFMLFQNYPNPFNPSTQIKFSVKGSGFVKIAVYNQLGQEVAVAANKEYEAGTHIINFDAGNLSSGIYFYRIEAGKYVAVKKMILMK